MKHYKKWSCFVLLTALMAACTEEDYKLYDTGQKDSVFFEYIDENEETATELDYVFNYDISNVHTVEIPVKLMGMPSDKERRISVKAVDEDTDMVEGIHYTIDAAVIPADAVESVLKVNLLRDKDPKIQEQAFTVTLELVEGDDLGAVGQTRFKITYSDIRPTQRPDWWSTWSGLSVYSFEAAQQFFKYFYELAPAANKQIFDEMIGAYGDYFVKAGSVQGPFAMYSNFLARYVTMPMYEDLKDVFEWQAIPQVN